MQNETKQDHSESIKRVVEVIIRIGLLTFIFGWCFLILSPFLSPVIWGMIIAVTLYPFYKNLTKLFRGHNTLAAVALTIVALLFILIPAALLAESMWDGITHLRGLYDQGQIIPPPDERVNSWPTFLKPVADLWKAASTNLQAVVVKYAPQLKDAASYLLGLLTGTGLGVLEFMASVIIAGVFLNYSKQGGDATRRVFTRLAGESGVKFAELSEVTIRNVVKGILGVAIIQSVLSGLGFFIAGVPLAGLWTLLCLILALVQVGVGPVVIGTAIYMFVTHDTLPAALFAVWSLIILLSDNILKPLLLGKGAPVPMLVVFLGSLGGFVANGFLGLFLGPVLLSVGYTLFKAWLGTAEDALPGTPTEAAT